MQPTLTTSVLAQCITYLDGLLQDNSPEETKNAWRQCCLGLKAIMGKLDSYRKNVVTAECFLRFFSRNIQNLLLCAASSPAGESAAQKAEEDLVFALNEEMAVLMREHCLRTGFKGLSDEERSFMNYFEANGSCFLGDGTMVSEYYYVTLPTRVIADFVRSLGGNTSFAGVAERALPGGRKRPSAESA